MDLSVYYCLLKHGIFYNTYQQGGWRTGSACLFGNSLIAISQVSSLPAVAIEPEKDCQSLALLLQRWTRGLGHHSPPLSPPLQPLQGKMDHSAHAKLLQHMTGQFCLYHAAHSWCLKGERLINPGLRKIYLNQLKVTGKQEDFFFQCMQQKLLNSRLCALILDFTSYS